MPTHCVGRSGRPSSQVRAFDEHQIMSILNNLVTVRPPQCQAAAMVRFSQSPHHCLRERRCEGLRKHDMSTTAVCLISWIAINVAVVGLRSCFGRNRDSAQRSFEVVPPRPVTCPFTVPAGAPMRFPRRLKVGNEFVLVATGFPPMRSHSESGDRRQAPSYGTRAVGLGE